jgi:hypothetical protein
MKLQLLTLCSTVMLTLTAHAGVIIPGGAFANSGLIPDGSAVGASGTATASGLNPYISDVSVSLNISGGYNGDLYAYLSHGGVLVPLLNRIGVISDNAFGSSGAGMTVILSDSGASGNIHKAGNGVLDGTYQADGQASNPLGSASSFSPSGGSIKFDAVGTGFGNMNPNGTWTLFIADLSAGGQSQLVSWNLGIIAEVPEPANVALGIFAGVFLVVTAARSQWARNRVQRCRAAFVQWVNAV